MHKIVLLAFDDPGGGLAVTSVIEELIKKRSLKLKIFSGKLSESFVNQFNFEKINSRITRKDAEELFNRISPDILVTATSGGNAEQELRNVAHDRNLKSVVILDFWKDYKRRWLYASYPIESMKDKVCVMDDYTLKEMLMENFPADNLIITGHPYLNKIFNDSKINAGKNGNVRNNILFFSQPLKIIGIKDYKTHPFEILLRALRKILKINNKEYFLKIKLHPSEKRNVELDRIVNSYNSNNLKIEFASHEKTLSELINESEIVFGYNTIAMFEARALNRQTISLNVVPVNESLTKAMGNAGIEILNADENEIIMCMTKDHNSENKHKFRKNIFGSGINNCVNVILNELNLS